MSVSRRELLFGTFARRPASGTVPGGAVGTPGVVRVQASCLTRRQLYCELCRDSCPEGVAAIRFAARGQLVIDEQACTGCGQCSARCPVTPPAIVVAA